MTDAFTIVLCYLVLTVGTYFIWPSKLNIVAHLNLGFAFIAFVLPIYSLHQDRFYSAQELHFFRGIMLTGACSFAVAMVLGAVTGSSIHDGRLIARTHALSKLHAGRSSGRLYAGLAIGILMILLAAVMMGGLPLFASDPMSAKFFRGAYAQSGLVSVLYRLGTGILTVLPPLALVLIFSDRRHRLRWTILSVSSIALMVATMQRGPLGQGALVALLATLVLKRRYILAVGAILGTYFLGAAFYEFLSWVGVSGSFGTPQGQQSFLARVAAGVPDFTDTMSFLHAWVTQGQPTTGGRTMFGGLIPGHYPWNPAVWSLHITNYGGDTSRINSGGLRLPTPVWGTVNFGTPGVIGLSAATGFVTGYIVRRAACALRGAQGVMPVVAVTLLLMTGLNTFGNLVTLSYLDVVEAGVLWWVLWPCLSKPEAESPRPLVHEPDVSITPAGDSRAYTR